MAPAANGRAAISVEQEGDHATKSRAGAAVELQRTG